MTLSILIMGVSKFKRNQIENEVLMVASRATGDRESNYFHMNMTISKVLTKYESHDMTHIYIYVGIIHV